MKLYNAPKKLKQVINMHMEKKGRHRHGDMMNEQMMKHMFKNKVMMKEIMEHLSDEDKKELAAAKLDMKIAIAEKKLEIMKEKKKIAAAKLDMKTSAAEKKVEILKMMRDMLKK